MGGDFWEHKLEYWQAQVNELSSYEHLYLKMSCQGSVNLCLIYTQFIEINVWTNLVLIIIVCLRDFIVFKNFLKCFMSVDKCRIRQTV